MYEAIVSENYSRPPSIDITSYTSQQKHKKKYEKIIFSVELVDDKLLELNLNDSRFDSIRQNLNDFINDANSATTISLNENFRLGLIDDYLTCIPPKGDCGVEVFGNFWFYGHVNFLDRHGRKSKKLYFTPRLLMGYIEKGTTKNGDVTYIERTINMGAFLLPHEIEAINQAFFAPFAHWHDL